MMRFLVLAAAATAFHGPVRRLTKAPVAIARAPSKRASKAEEMLERSRRHEDEV